MLSSQAVFKIILIATLVIFLSGCASSPPSQEETLKLKYARYGHTVVADDEAIYVIGGSSERGFDNTVERIDPKTKRVMPVYLIPRRYATAVWDGKDSIYIFGGVSVRNGRSHYESTIEILNTRTGRVSRTQMNVPRRYNSGAHINGVFYVVGGSVITQNPEGTEDILLATPLVTAYNFDEQQMLRLRDLPDARDTRVFTYNQKLCAIGGYNHGEVFKRFDCYDPSSDTWERMPDAPMPVSAHSVTMHDDILYVFGDYTNLDQVLTFDFTANEWAISDLPYQASRHNAAVTFDDEIFVIGGTTDSKGPALDTIQVFKVGN